MIDVDGNSPPQNTTHCIRARCRDQGEINEFATEIQNFWAQNGMLCERHCKANNIDSKHWKRTEPARTHRHVELHNSMIDHQEDQAIDEDRHEDTTGQRHTDLNASLGRSALEALREFKESNNCSWGDSDKEFLDDSEEEEEEVTPPRRKRIRRSSS